MFDEDGLMKMFRSFHCIAVGKNSCLYKVGKNSLAKNFEALIKQLDQSSIRNEMCGK